MNDTGTALTTSSVHPPQGSLPAGLSTDRPGVLMVDDQPARLLSYEAILSGLGVRCVRALSGAEALERLLAERFAVILLDVSMPGMDGFELAQLIREHPRFENTPIIFITGVHISELDQLKGYQSGAIDYIAVPIVPEILRSKVAVLVELYQRRSELQAVNHALSQAREQLRADHARVLAATEAQLRGIFENPGLITTVMERVPDGAGAPGRWVFRNANALALQTLGHTRETLIGQDLSAILADPDRARRAADRCRESLEQQRVVRYESRLRDRDMLVTVFPLDEHSVVSSALDITDRKNAERALRISEERYRLGERRLGAVLESAPVGVCFCNIEGRFEYVNAAFCQLVGYRAEQLLAMRWQDISHPEDVQLGSAASASVLSGSAAHYRIEKRYLHRDGSVVWVELYGNFVRDDEGRPVQDVAMAMDVTERRASEQRLRESSQRFRELANNIDQIVWTTDAAGRITWFNDRWFEFTGTAIDPSGPPDWRGYHHPEHRERVLSHLAQRVAEGAAWEDTFPLRGREGEYRWFLSRAVPIRDAEGRVLRWFGTCTDVTDQRRLQQALREADRRKDEFLAMLAHELRNPVAPIRTAADVLLRQLGSDEQKSALVRVVDRQALQLSRLLDDLLDVARITQGRIQLKLEDVAVSSCLELAVEMVQPLIRERGHRLSVVQTPVAMHVRADKVRLVQCISNLLTNAAKYTQAGGDIRLRSRDHGTLAIIEVQDNGAGLAPDLLPHLFEPFVQSERTLDRSQGGLGLGLSICRQLMRMHDGDVLAASAGPGLGSTFTIQLPRIDEPAGTGSGAPAAQPGGRRVLVVDDNQDAASTLAMLLEMEGYQARACFSPEDALSEMESFRPEIALLDIGLPRIDGYELARRMRAMTPDVRMAALSGYGQSEDRRRSQDAGFDGHFVKPVDVATLTQWINHPDGGAGG